MKTYRKIMLAMVFMVLGLSACASVDSLNVSREATMPAYEQYYCCTMGGSIQGMP